MLCSTQRKIKRFLIFPVSVAELYEYAMLPEHMESPDPTVGPSSITETGALACSSGSKTGRVPKDKRIVLDAETKDVSS
jgi:ATP-dependent phosphoenolpyruvate carboxykinase